jgi:hypothetical protein
MKLHILIYLYVNKHYCLELPPLEHSLNFACCELRFCRHCYIIRTPAMTLKIKTENETEPRAAASSTAGDDSVVADVVISTPVVKQESATGSPFAVGVVRQNPVVTPSATVARAVVKKEEPSTDSDWEGLKPHFMVTPYQTASSAEARAVSVVKQEKAAFLQSRKRSAASSVPAFGVVPIKRPKTHLESDISRMEYNFRWAGNYADEGNRYLMDYNLGEARKHAEKAGALNAAFHARVSRMRCSMNEYKAKTPWTRDETMAFIEGVKLFGVGSWAQIKSWAGARLKGRDNVQIKDKWPRTNRLCWLRERGLTLTRDDHRWGENVSDLHKFEYLNKGKEMNNL